MTLFLSLALAVLALFLPPQVWGEEDLYLDLNVDFTSGDYGTGLTTETFVTAVTLGFRPQRRLELGVTVPYIVQSTGAVVASGDLRFRLSRDAPMLMYSTTPRVLGPGGGGGMDGPSTTPSPEEQSSSQRGLGDVDLFAEVTLLMGEGRGPQVKLLLNMTLPTGDEERGLGTGESALGVGGSVSQLLGPWELFGDLTRVFQSEGDFNLQDYWVYEVGGSYLLRDNFAPYLSLWGASEPISGAEATREMRAGGSVLLGDMVLGFYGAWGLTEESIDWGGGISLTSPF